MTGTDPRSAGLWRSVAGPDGINFAAWQRAEEAGDIIGTCRACGGFIVSDSPPPYIDDAVSVTWLYARCLTCQHEVASPGGRVLRRSGRLSQRPTH